MAVPRSVAPGGVAASRGRGWEGSWLQTRQASPSFVDSPAGVLGETGHQSNVRVEPGPPFSGLPPSPPAPEDLLLPGTLPTLPRSTGAHSSAPLLGSHLHSSQTPGQGYHPSLPERPPATASPTHSVRVRVATGLLDLWSPRSPDPDPGPRTSVDPAGSLLILMAGEMSL